MRIRARTYLRSVARVYHTWSDTVDSDPAHRPLHRQRLCQVFYTGTRGASVCHPWKPVPHIGGDVDDATAVLTHPRGVGSAAAKKSTRQIGLNDGRPTFHRDACGRGRELAAAIIDKDV